MLNELRTGNNPVCPECRKGKLIAVGDPKTAHCFTCDNKHCDFMINIDFAREEL